MKTNALLRSFCYLSIFICACTRVDAQKLNSAYLDYISRYEGMAVDQMNRYGIPASITLSQGLLESAAGQSTLATKANNHFGIKTGGTWNGPYILRDDDRANEKFRKYSSVAESFEDHSLFLKKPRYAQLFKLNMTDYKGWAKGLKACGYATSPTYAEKLINIIELYRLYEYDTKKRNVASTTTVTHHSAHNPTDKYTSHGDADFFASHPVGENNKNFYIRVLPGDDLETISKEVGVSKRKLCKYNELPKDIGQLKPGTILYFKSKRSHADKGFKHHPHVVVAEQSLYDIAQMYGIKLKSLYKMNKLYPDYVPSIGDQLRVY